MDARRNWPDLPDSNGRFGAYGGRYVAETLMPLVLDLERAYRTAQADPAFAAQMDEFWRDYVGRPSPLYF
ncbi:MAG: tryptophan synthase subunit beta, partial [Hyphomonadaceae bacterium]